MIPRILVPVLLLSMAIHGRSQSPVLLKCIDPGSHSVAFSIDFFGQVFTVDQSGSFLRFDTSGTRTALAGQRKLSNFWSIDASNPHKVILFNRDLQTATIISSDLAITSTYDLTSWSDNDVSLMCRCPDGGFRLYCQYDQTLLRVSPAGALTSNIHLNLPIFLDDFKPDQLSENESGILLSQKKGHAVFLDPYGNFQFALHDSASSRQLSGPAIYSLTNDSISVYHPVLHQTVWIGFPNKSIIDFAFIYPYMVLYCENKFFVYKIP